MASDVVDEAIGLDICKGGEDLTEKLSAETRNTVSLSCDKCWCMLSGSLRSSVATLTVADIVGLSPSWNVSLTACRRIKLLAS